MLNRRGLITGLISFVAAPAIVRVDSIMPIKSYKHKLVLIDSLTNIKEYIIDETTYNALANSSPHLQYLIIKNIQLNLT